ncbi:putative efflux pump antibiotic resistance protein [Pseudomassariella vexata]|uniref:Putative efflux pump antibiotic resistance protein n=1 Tax=Pseudomassariella vexata TaxID=1141098 RepID=A0A1Y2DGN3_9PEZI|nr:putative efflux pump antibiotic resistance protein [Pseudomassariella vexata]ORY58377.1 putative efflux pump antibiotic resistance protein [Pseudomassariella vexata]
MLCNLHLPMETRFLATVTSSKKQQGQSQGSRSWFFAYSSVVASVLLFSIDNTIVTDIQPFIIEAFQDTAKLPWIGVSFSLGAITILPLGKAYGIFNIKWLFLLCVIVFEVGNVVCGAAPNMNTIIVGRVISGVGGSSVYSGALTYVSIMTGKDERPLYLAGGAAMWGIGSVIGPVIGGAFAVSNATWRWAFYINVVVAALLAIPFALCLPNHDPIETMSMGQKMRTQDWIGIITFAAGSACFTMALTFGGVVFPFNSGSIITLWVMTGVLLIAFILVTIYYPGVSSKHRMYPVHFIKRMELNILQGDDAILAAVRILSLICMIVAFAVLNGALMPKLGYYMPWYLFGNATILAGSALMYTITAETPTSQIYGYTALIGVGIGSFLTAGFAVVQALVPVADVNNAVGFMSIGQIFGAITFLAMAGPVFQNVGFQKLSAILPAASVEEVQGLAAGTSSVLFQSLNGATRIQVVEQVTLAMRNGFAVLIAGAALGFISAMFLNRCQFRSVKQCENSISCLPRGTCR